MSLTSFPVEVSTMIYQNLLEARFITPKGQRRATKIGVTRSGARRATAYKTTYSIKGIDRSGVKTLLSVSLTCRKIHDEIAHYLKVPLTIKFIGTLAPRDPISILSTLVPAIYLPSLHRIQKAIDAVPGHPHYPFSYLSNLPALRTLQLDHRGYFWNKAKKISSLYTEAHHSNRLPYHAKEKDQALKLKTSAQKTYALLLQLGTRQGRSTGDGMPKALRRMIFDPQRRLKLLLPVTISAQEPRRPNNPWRDVLLYVSCWD